MSSYDCLNVKTQSGKRRIMGHRKRIFENIGSLFMLQGANYILPLITMPYLVRVLGAEKYGLLAVAFAICQYMAVITVYGFDFTATRRIAINRTDPEAVQKIYCSVMFTKLILLAISFVIFIALVLAIKSFRLEWKLYLISYLSVIGSVLFPTWLYQGMERMKYITALNIFAKILSTGAIFVFVKNNCDYKIAALLQSLNMLVPGMLSIFLVRQMFAIRFTYSVKFSEIRSELVEGGKVFSSTLAGNIYGQGAIVILGLVAVKASVGYYAIAQKVAGAIVGLVQPFAQALYPYLCKLYHDNRGRYNKIKSQSIAMGSITFTIFGMLVMFLSRRIAVLLSGASGNELVVLIKIYSVIIIFTMMNVWLNCFILSMQRFNEMRKMYVSVAMIFLVVSLPASIYLGSYGMAFSILFVEIYIFIYGSIIARW